MSLKSILILTSISLAFAVSASADKMSDQKASLQSACQSDLQKFCSDVTSGDHRAMSCLKSHEDQLSSGCSSEWAKSKASWNQAMKEGRNACADDVQKFCGNINGGPKEVSSCLSSHTSDLSNSCKNFTMSHHQMGGQAPQNDISVNPPTPTYSNNLNSNGNNNNANNTNTEDSNSHM